ncbi:hypothetical protein OQJ19_08735 [Fluoribacter gormanii]|uniref:Uncharacterized protein n=1 Tax=Fluoribacter gormanii TaxID=464 RepID=A0A377GNE4_9GAMM|nr:hypothetical protein [Fluoribacter gormanii]KTD04467.1 hypothetical protein Lgor_1016 [Fluoribacter gormanii]MCW8445488.1 hypothetical protein [Fluoribacter gormanii]MCW8470738.1 hypothetical protein [Fluoribacter gormanii]SIR89342.1 hypothetical protein SAMN05421777_13716 [Fluoribacter gormanii]STO26144.1 Uncharacterised protein [Fluoribacter gormanii]
MGIFKDMTDRYCQKILETYQTQADEKTYKGKEAELLVQRNDFAKCLITKIKEIDVNDNDYLDYFERILKEINLNLKEVKAAVKEYNKECKTEFTTDLYESLFNSSLINFINALRNLFESSPSLITDIKDKSLFSNERNVPWICQFSFILYEYILEREFDIAVNKADRDIFDAKKQLIFKYIQSVGDLCSRFNKKEDDVSYQELMKALLKNMRSEEQKIQRRQEENPTSYNVMSYFYKASEKIVGKNQLGQKIELLVNEFDGRALQGLVCK